MSRGNLRFGLLVGILVTLVGHFTTRASIQGGTLIAFWIVLGIVVTLVIAFTMEHTAKAKDKRGTPPIEPSGTHLSVRSEHRTTVSTTGKFFAITKTPSSSELRALTVDAPSVPGNPVTTRLKLIIEKYDHYQTVPIEEPDLLGKPLAEIASWAHQAAATNAPSNLAEATLTLAYLRSEGPLDGNTRSPFGWTFLFFDGMLGVRATVTVTRQDALITYNTAPSYPKLPPLEWLDLSDGLGQLLTAIQGLQDQDLYLRVNFPCYYYLFTRRPLAMFDLQAAVKKPHCAQSFLSWTGPEGLEPFPSIAQLIDRLHAETCAQIEARARIEARVGIQPDSGDHKAEAPLPRPTQDQASTAATGQQETPSDIQSGVVEQTDRFTTTDQQPSTASSGLPETEGESLAADIQLARDLLSRHEIVLRTTAKQLFDTHGPQVVEQLAAAVLECDGKQPSICHTLLFLLAFLPSALTLNPLCRLASQTTEETAAITRSLFDRRRKWELGVYPDPIEPLGFEESRTLLGKTALVRLGLKSTFDPENDLLPPLAKAGLVATRIRLLSGDTELFLSANLVGEDGCTEGFLSSSPLPMPCNILRLVGPEAERLSQRVQVSTIAYSRESIIADVTSKRPYDLHRGALYMAALGIGERSTFEALAEGIRSHRSNMELRRACLAAVAQVDHPGVIPLLESLDSAELMDLCVELLDQCKRRSVAGTED
ncbi:MAG: hypothetical protein JW797_11980 [Bradymonadales bacterium]|nr:hypothetical protein [Bradymonadales bacterium]